MSNGMRSCAQCARDIVRTVFAATKSSVPYILLMAFFAFHSIDARADFPSKRSPYWIVSNSIPVTASFGSPEAACLGSQLGILSCASFVEFVQSNAYGRDSGNCYWDDVPPV